MQPVTYIAAQAHGWKYRKGTSEATAPVEAWRAVGFDDSGWLAGQTGIGYGDPGVNTTLSDMRRRTGVAGYASVYFRKAFTVPADAIPRQLRLRVRIDDGCVVWLNGVEVDRRYVGAGQLAFNYLAPANHDNNQWDEVLIDNADTLLVGGTNVIAVHGFNTTLTSGDFSLDLELTSLAPDGSPTPGAANGSARAIDRIPPQIRQVAHHPARPPSGQAVTITARITDPDGMGPVGLSYQLVDPGSYIRLGDPAYQTAWTTVPMRDDGGGGDATAGDSTYTAVLPGLLQTHRRLVRYRISCADASGNGQGVPYEDDEQPNFAYFVYDGMPAWTGALRPAAFGGFPATPAATYPSALLESMPALHLLATATDVADCQYNSSFNATRFRGTVVQGEVVHDHIEFRVRGIGSTYQSGKNKWNLYFNRARDYQAHDNYGRPFKETWNNLLVNANASPWAAVHRGSAGVEEALSNRIFQLGGMAAMHSTYFQLRVIDDALEASPVSQYEGDLWGLYLGLEPTEGNFLDERGLEKGNLYAIEGNNGDKKYQGPTQPVDSSDWIAFRNALAETGQSEQWYRDNIDLPALYTFLGLNRLIGNVDVRPGDNYRFYHRPGDGRWVIIPYDMDMQFIAAHHWGGGMDGVTVAGAPNAIRAIMRHPALAMEYRNRCRELLSLMASDGAPDGGQIGQLVDEFAGFVHPPGGSPTWAELDAALWNLHPRTTGGGGNSGQSSHKGNFFRATYLDGPRGGLGGTAQTGSWIRSLADADGDGFSDHPGLMRWFVDYATNTWPGGTWNRKAMTGIGTGGDGDPDRQRGYGYKYLEFESLHGGYANALANPAAAPDTSHPAKPVIAFAGAPGHAVNDLVFTSSAFDDPQGPGTYAAHQWRIAGIAAPGLPGFEPGMPRTYEIETLWSSGELVTPPGQQAIPLGVAEPGKTYRVRVRHKDTSGRWSFWSEPVQFTAAAPVPGTLIHYWNFNSGTSLLVPTQSSGGGALTPALAPGSEAVAGTGQDFNAANARIGDPAGSHLRVNTPLGAVLDIRIPTPGFENIVVQYETRRSGQGAGLQEISYTLDGTAFQPFATIAVADAAPVVQTLDFRSVAGVADNPAFALRVVFLQGGGGTAGNNRFDNLTVEGVPVHGAGLPLFLPGGTASWHEPAHWAGGTVPDGAGALALLGAPASGDREVTLDAPVTVGNLHIDNAGSPFRNRLGGAALTFDGGGGGGALLTVAGDGPGFVEFDLAGVTTLATALTVDVPHPGGDPEHGALRLRGMWAGPGGLFKSGPGTASLTGAGKAFTGAVTVAGGVLQTSEPAAPAQAAGIAVLPGGQLRLTSGSEGGPARIHSFGGTLSLAGDGRGPAVPQDDPMGVPGALRYAPGAGAHHAVVTNAVQLAAAAAIHVAEPGNLLELAGPLSGPGSMSKTGGGSLVLAGSNPAYAGPLAGLNGALAVDGDLSGAPVELAAEVSLAGAGAVGAVSGAGLVRLDGTVLRAAAASVAGMAFTFDRPGLPALATPAAAGNSLLRLEGPEPLPVAPARVDCYLGPAAWQPGDRIRGGLFTPAGFDLAAALAGTEMRLFVADPAGANLTPRAQLPFRRSGRRLELVGGRGGARFRRRPGGRQHPRNPRRRRTRRLRPVARPAFRRPARSGRNARGRSGRRRGGQPAVLRHGAGPLRAGPRVVAGARRGGRSHAPPVPLFTLSRRPALAGAGLARPRWLAPRSLGFGRRRTPGCRGGLVQRQRDRAARARSRRSRPGRADVAAARGKPAAVMRRPPDC
jgi:autotransporter-associated beta strand protein